jgi:DNA-binding MarR family transcriptional regulator
MATTQESTRPLPLIGQSVGQAQASLTRLLTGILAESGTSYQAWLGLQRLTALGGQATREAYERDLSDWLQLDRPAASRLAGGLVTAGLADTGDGAIRLTAQGRGLRQEVLAASATITEPMLATIDHDDLETTVRTLDEITRRARGIPAGPITTEGNR